MFSYQVMLVCSMSYHILVHCSLRHGCMSWIKTLGRRWRPSISLVPRPDPLGTRLTKYMSADTSFCFHYANAYEDKGNDMLSVKLLPYVIMLIYMHMQYRH